MVIGWQRYEVLSCVSWQLSANLEPLRGNASGGSSSCGFQAIAGFQKLLLDYYYYYYYYYLKIFADVGIFPEGELVLAKSCKAAGAVQKSCCPL